MKRKQILKMAVAQFGEDKQIDMCVEEMAELIKALMKYRRYRDDELIREGYVQGVQEEMADVQIMLDQMCLVFGNTQSIQSEKLSRLENILIGAWELERAGAREEEDVW